MDIEIFPLTQRKLPSQVKALSPSIIMRRVPPSGRRGKSELSR